MSKQNSSPLGAEKNMAPCEKGKCPLVQNPLAECYCSKVDSRSAQLTLFYCGGQFEDCSILQRHLEVVAAD